MYLDTVASCTSPDRYVVALAITRGKNMCVLCSLSLMCVCCALPLSLSLSLSLRVGYTNDPPTA